MRRIGLALLALCALTAAAGAQEPRGLVVDEGVLELAPEPGTLFVFPGEGAQERPGAELNYRALGAEPADAEAAAAAPVAPTGETLRVGFFPLLTAAQLYLMAGEEWAAEYGFRIVPRQFLTAEKMTEALTGGEIQLAFMDGGQALVAWERGADPIVIAASAIDSVGLYARGETALLLESADPVDAIRRRNEEEGQRITIAVIDETSSANAALNIWAFDTMRLTADELRIPSGALIDVWKAALRGRVNAVLAPEPLLTSLMEQDDSGRVVLDGARLLAGQPTGVVVASAAAIRDHRPLLKDFLRLHRRATRRLRDDPGAAAEASARYAGFNRLQPPAMAVALRARVNRFIDDPELLVEPMAVLADYQRRRGLLFRDAPLNAVINESLFSEVEAETPLDPLMEVGPAADAPPLTLAPG